MTCSADEDLKALPASAKPTIEESDPFWGVDLVVGRIVKAWKHEKADKLICEVIDCGEAFGGERKIASGLFLFYRPEEIEVVVCEACERVGKAGRGGSQPEGEAAGGLSQSRNGALRVQGGPLCRGGGFWFGDSRVDSGASCGCGPRNEGDAGGSACLEGGDEGD